MQKSPRHVLCANLRHPSPTRSSKQLTGTKYNRVVRATKKDACHGLWGDGANMLQQHLLVRRIPNAVKLQYRCRQCNIPDRRPHSGLVALYW